MGLDRGARKPFRVVRDKADSGDRRSARDVIVGVVVLAAVAGATVLTLIRHADLAPLFAFTGAILVALLTAYWTQRRLTQDLTAADGRLVKQLQAETERQAQQLQHEVDRQARQHNHDRQRAEIDDLRAALGDALVAAYRAREAILDHPDRYYDTDQRDRSAEAIRETEAQLAKLQVRLGKDHPISISFATMANCAISLHRLRSEGAATTIPNFTNDPTVMMWGNAYTECVRLAQLRVGSRGRPVARRAPSRDLTIAVSPNRSQPASRRQDGSDRPTRDLAAQASPREHQGSSDRAGPGSAGIHLTLGTSSPAGLKGCDGRADHSIKHDDRLGVTRPSFARLP